ncbi:hypothetical protein [Methylocapsa palsarum]|nr:hypothetical protein [Methylocapsa palsarum]
MTSASILAAVPALLLTRSIASAQDGAAPAAPQIIAASQDAALPALLPLQDFAAAQAGAPAKFRELETKYIFGFTTGSDIGIVGELAIESETNLEFQKRQGVFNALEQEVELEWNPIDALEIEASVHGVFSQIHNVDGFDNFHGANFGGLSTKVSYNAIARGPGAPIGLTFSAEPEWGRVNDNGRVSTAFGVTGKIVADTELVPDRLYAAFNAIYSPEVGRDFGDPKWERGATLGATTAVTYRLSEHVTLGGELEYYRAYDSLGFQGFAGDAVYAGPTLFAKLTPKLLLAAAFSTQITGHAAGINNPLDLTNFSRNKARLLIEYEF